MEMENDFTVTKEKISAALQGYGGSIDDRSALLNHIMQALGDVDSEEFDGWTITRVIGPEFKGTRGSVRKMWGYKAVHSETGRTEEFPPDSTGDVRIAIVRLMLKQSNKLHAMTIKTT